MTQEPLPRGRNDQPLSPTQAKQRLRLLVAMADVSAEDGYLDTSVATVIKRAGVSRKTFYELFTDKEDCFLQAYDLGASVLLDAVTRARAEPGTWEEQLERGFVALTDTIARSPSFTKLCIREVWAAGSTARRRHYDTNRRFAVFTDDIREELGDVVYSGIIGGISGILLREVVQGDIARSGAWCPIWWPSYGSRWRPGEPA